MRVCVCLLNLTNTRYYFCHCVKILKKKIENNFEKKIIFEFFSKCRGGGSHKGENFSKKCFLFRILQFTKKSKKKIFENFEFFSKCRGGGSQRGKFQKKIRKIVRANSEKSH